MTYLAFLARFILILTPILTAALLMWTMHRSGRNLPASLRAWPAIPDLWGTSFWPCSTLPLGTTIWSPQGYDGTTRRS